MKTSQVKAAKKILKGLVKEKRKVQNFKAKDSEISTIKANAKKYADGNVAHWIRHAAMNYKPRAEELSN